MIRYAYEMAEFEFGSIPTNEKQNKVGDTNFQFPQK